ncbi:MAG TPA: TspO/MBR family protein [Patescibacteria group bacterium]|nr:TspO/MBR family protein [Patescibacteria group bacterium]
MKKKIKKWFPLIVSIAVCQSAGGIGALATNQSVQTWYQELNKPSFSPPDWIFGPVWTLLYLLMGVALFLLWQKKEKTSIAIIFFGIQLILNSLWSIIFFGWHSPLFALGEIIFLEIAILTTIILAWRQSRPAAILLLPYLLWVGFATVLNWQIYLLN